mgnify:CR=1 FL=1
MTKVLALLFFITAVLITACTPKYKTVNGCEIQPRTQCSKFDLSETDLRWAKLRWADLRGAKLGGTSLLSNLHRAIYNKLTKFPEDFDPESVWMLLAE